MKFIKSKIGKSIKTFNQNDKEEFLTVESIGGDIALFKGCKKVNVVTRRECDGIEYFIYRGINYSINI